MAARTYIEQQVNQVLRDPTQADPAQLRVAYLYHLYKQVSALDLLGVDPKAASADVDARLRLDAVYTALLIDQPERDEHEMRRSVLDQDGRGERITSAIEALNSHQYLVLLGDPGSGKSTFVNFAALCLAGELLQQAKGQRFAANLELLMAPLPTDDGNDQAQAQPWEHGPLLPVRIILRDFAARGLPAADQAATTAHLWAFIGNELKSAGLGDYQELLRNELLSRGGLVLFDGLDEVLEAEQQRDQIKQVVEDFAATFHRCRIVVTSRTYAYQQQAWQLKEFTVRLLSPLTDGQIRRFVDRWYMHSAEQRRGDSEDSQGRAERLKEAIFASERLRARWPNAHCC